MRFTATIFLGDLFAGTEWVKIPGNAISVPDFGCTDTDPPKWIGAESFPTDR